MYCVWAMIIEDAAKEKIEAHLQQVGKDCLKVWIEEKDDEIHLRFACVNSADEPRVIEVNGIKVAVSEPDEADLMELHCTVKDDIALAYLDADPVPLPPHHHSGKTYCCDGDRCGIKEN